MAEEMPKRVLVDANGFVWRDFGDEEWVSMAKVNPDNEPIPVPVQVYVPVPGCWQSKRADGEHSWRFDGDNPYILCSFCGERRDALTGGVIPAPRALAGLGGQEEQA